MSAHTHLRCAVCGSQWHIDTQLPERTFLDAQRHSRLAHPRSRPHEIIKEITP